LQAGVVGSSPIVSTAVVTITTIPQVSFTF